MARYGIISSFIVLAATVLPAQGAPVKGSLAVSAFITGAGNCTVKNTQNIAFGTLDPTNPVNVQASGSVGVHCVGIDPGSTVVVSQSSPAPLTLKSGSNTILYSLELPASSTQITNRNAVNLTIPVVADIQGANYRFAPAGSYSDTVTLQINP